jgi:hypothetical protein
MRKRFYSVIAATLVFAGCGGGAGPILTPGPAPTSTGGGLDNTGLRSITVMAVPNVAAGSQGTPFTYDFASVDATAGKYYLSDRTNKSVDIFSTSSLSTPVIEVRGFTGIGPTFPTSGPNDIAVVPGSPLIYATDVDTVRVIDTSTDQITQSIVTSKSGLRSDADCYDADDKIVMADNGADMPPFVAYISTATNTVTSKLTFGTSSGLEACQYDPGTKNFFINNDGTPTNPNGELDVIPAASVVAGAPAVSARYPEGNCGPGGIALGPNEELVIGCDAPNGDPQVTLIMSATTGAILKTISQVGGSDQVAYDARFGRCYTASRNMTSNGIAGSGTVTPVLGVIDARRLVWLGNVPTSINSHSVAADPTTGHVFVPIAATATTAGGVEVFGVGI